MIFIILFFTGWCSSWWLPWCCKHYAPRPTGLLGTPRNVVRVWPNMELINYPFSTPPKTSIKLNKWCIKKNKKVCINIHKEQKQKNEKNTGKNTSVLCSTWIFSAPPLAVCVRQGVGQKTKPQNCKATMMPIPAVSMARKTDCGIFCWCQKCQRNQKEKNNLKRFHITPDTIFVSPRQDESKKWLGLFLLFYIQKKRGNSILISFNIFIKNFFLYFN